MFAFEVDETSDLPLWVQLRNRLIYLINTGSYKPGDQLPTVRGLASDISINYNTVNKAYLSLMSEGYIVSTRGRGAFVCDLEEDEEGEGHAADKLLQDCISACLELGLTYDEIGKRLPKLLRNMEKNGKAKKKVGGDI
ncbi:MAG: GntR family transcriptional regulator [Raoultibacter sp.]